MADPELIKAVAQLLGAIAWPLVLSILLVSQRKAIGSLIDSLEAISFGGVDAKLKRTVDEEAAAIVGSEPDAGRKPTERQPEAAQRVHDAGYGNLAAVRHQVESLAAEYERLRATMSSGNARTRRMEIVATKLRTLGLASAPLLPELTSSAAAGKRLAAVMALQVSANPEYLDWLGSRVAAEKPFIAITPRLRSLWPLGPWIQRIRRQSWLPFR